MNRILVLITSVLIIQGCTSVEKLKVKNIKIYYRNFDLFVSQPKKFPFELRTMHMGDSLKIEIQNKLGQAKFDLFRNDSLLCSGKYSGSLGVLGEYTLNEEYNITDSINNYSSNLILYNFYEPILLNSNCR